MNRRERTLVLATLVAGASAAGAWGTARLASAVDAAASAARSLRDCERLARRIDAARGVSSAADVEAGIRGGGGGGGAKSPDLTRRIEAAARAANLPEDRVIEPGRARRLGDGPFVEHPTGVQLRGIDLRQLFAFLHELASEDARVGLKSIRLTTAPGETSTDRWNVDGTLTQTIYSPADSSTRRPARVGRAASGD